MWEKVNIGGVAEAATVGRGSAALQGVGSHPLSGGLPPSPKAKSKKTQDIRTQLALNMVKDNTFDRLNFHMQNLPQTPKSVLKDCVCLWYLPTGSG